MKIILAIIAFFIMLSLWGFYLAIRPFRIVSSVTPKDFGVAYDNVSFRTQDNVLLRGWFIPSKQSTAKTIILLHGYPADKGDILPSRLFLHETYNLLLFDFRYFGESEGSYSTIGKYEVFDLLSAIKYLRSKKINEVGVWGLSLGGAVALMTAPQAPEIKVIVAQSSYARLDWIAYTHYRIPLLRYILGELLRFWTGIFFQFDIKKISPAIAVEKLTIPILLIYSKEDRMIPIEHGLLLQQALQHDPNLQVIMTDQGAHGEQIKNEEQIVRDFFKRYL
ncbi:MAG TPA: alpha/beta fold hydrolase [Gammaproteobacteria bacterium]|nr:alpha/beta fold hydrolase [Gammaproteobacteria bacterium]